MVGVCVCRVRRLLPVGMRAWAGICVPLCSLLSCWRLDRHRGWSLCRRRALGVVLNCIIGFKGTRHKQNSLSGNTLFNYMPTYTRSQKKS